jgi:hypothetical protein
MKIELLPIGFYVARSSTALTTLVRYEHDFFVLSKIQAPSALVWNRRVDDDVVALGLV